MRDIMRRIATGQINKLRPLSQYGVVHSIAPDRSYCRVRFGGDEETVKVSIGSLAPSSPGQTVRVAGTPGDRYVDDVLGPVVVVGGGMDIGDIFIWPGTTPPANCFACKGGTVSVDSYPVLYGVCQYGHGGSGNIFGIPTIADPGPNLMYVIRAF